MFAYNFIQYKYNWLGICVNKGKQGILIFVITLDHIMCNSGLKYVNYQLIVIVYSSDKYKSFYRNNQ